MKTGAKAKGRTKSPRELRQYFTAMLSPHTKSRIELLAKLCEVSQGVIVDRALDAIDVCGTCDGEGVYEEGGREDRCPECHGLRVFPRERY